MPTTLSSPAATGTLPCLQAIHIGVVVWWCFCGGVFGVFVVVFLWWCFCGGVLVVVFLW